MFLCSNLWLGELCTDNANEDKDNDARYTEHACIGSLTFMPEVEGSNSSTGEGFFLYF